MKLRDLTYWARFVAVTAASATITVAALTAVSARAADLSADSLKLAPGVTKAAEGFETPPTAYIVANPTSVFSDHSYFGTKVTGELKRGEHVEALAKVKGYDWVLVGKNGQGLGYVPISMLSPADQYHA
jgi:hypothetical protein